MSLAKFPSHSDFRRSLVEAVDAYFERSGRRRHGGPSLWIKTALMIGWAVGSYVALMFYADVWWKVVPASISLSLAIAGIGFNVQHDGGHGAYDRSRWLNRGTARMLDLIGGSSYVWRYKHNLLHHHNTNVEGIDDDLHSEPFLRMAPGQPRRWYHRFQHLYIWVLYGLLPPKWEWWDDFRSVVRGRVGDHPIPRPRKLELAWLLVGKALFAGWVFVLPLFLHPVVNVVAVYAFVCLVTGITLGTVFQMAHCVEEARFEPAPARGATLPRPWAEHQLATTVDFAPRNPILTWYLGGLNFQVEHHLFPQISHIHYPRLAPIVREVSARFGLDHLCHPTMRGAIRSHVRHMRELGRSVVRRPQVDAA